MSPRRTHSIWATHRDLSGAYVGCGEDDTIELYIPDPPPRGLLVNLGARGDARMIARRINECLDATVKS